MATDCSWKVVLKVMAEAKGDITTKTDFNAGVGMASALVPTYIDLMPDDYGLGVIKGALALIFEVS